MGSIAFASMFPERLACCWNRFLIVTADDDLAAGDAIERERFAKFGEVLADAVDEPGVVVPDDDAVGGENFECGFGVSFDALVGVAAVDEAQVGIGERVGWGEGEGVASELVDAGGGGVVEEGEAGGGAGEADPLLVAFAEGFDLSVGVLFGEIEGVDLGLGGVERHREGADAAKGSGLEDLLGAERTDDGCEQGVGNDKAQAGEADSVDRREDDLAGFVAAEEGGEVGVFDDGERIAGVEGMLADAAAKLNNVAAGPAVCYANGCQFKQVAEHGEEVPGVDSIAARLWGRDWPGRDFRHG